LRFRKFSSVFSFQYEQYYLNKNLSVISDGHVLQTAILILPLKSFKMHSFVLFTSSLLQV